MEASSPPVRHRARQRPPPGPDPVAIDAPSRGLILMVDDEPAIARAYARTLGDGRVHGGDRAATAARRRTPRASKSFDVIVSDIAMPEMDGLELLRAVREHDLDVPFIIMTGGPAVESAVAGDGVRRAPLPHQAGRARGAGGGGRARGAPAPDGARSSARRWRCSAWRGSTSAIGPAWRRASGGAMETLWIAYQPIVSWSRRRRSFAYEALVRNEEPTLRIAARPVRGGRAAGAAAGAGAHRPRPRRAHAGRAADCRRCCSSTCTRWSWTTTR